MLARVRSPPRRVYESEINGEERIAHFCQRSHIKRLGLFGSVAQGGFGPDSDVDGLVDFEPGHAPDFSELFDMERELSAVSDDCKAGLRLAEDLNRYARDKRRAQTEVEHAPR